VRRREVDDPLAAVGAQHRLGVLREAVVGRERVLRDLAVVVPGGHRVVGESRFRHEHLVAGLQRGPREVVDRAVGARRDPHLLGRHVPLLGQLRGEVGVRRFRVLVDAVGVLADRVDGRRARPVGFSFEERA